MKGSTPGLPMHAPCHRRHAGQRQVLLGILPCRSWGCLSHMAGSATTCLAFSHSLRWLTGGKHKHPALLVPSPTTFFPPAACTPSLHPTFTTHSQEGSLLSTPHLLEPAQTS